MVTSVILFAIFFGSYLIFVDKVEILGNKVYLIKFLSDEVYELPYELRTIWLIVIFALGTIMFIKILKYLKEYY